MKRCSRCHNKKSLDSFDIDIKNPDGLRKTCQQCREEKAAYALKNKDKIAIRDRNYYLENKERISIRNRQYYEDNKEEILATNALYYQAHKPEPTIIIPLDPEEKRIRGLEAAARYRAKQRQQKVYMRPVYPTVQDAFYAKIALCEHGEHCPFCCHLWTASINNSGYGQFFPNPGKLTLAHRMAWIFHNQRHIPPGLYICHHCDVRICCNVQHLFLGTRQDNVDDMMRKRRQSKEHRQKSSSIWSW